MHRPTLRQPLLVLAAALCTAATFTGAQLGSASGVSLAPSRIEIAVGSTTAAPTGTPTSSAPSAIVEAGKPFTVTVRLYAFDASGTVQDASYSKDTRLTLTATSDTDDSPVAVAGGPWVAPKGLHEFPVTAQITTPVNQVLLKVSGPGPKNTTIDSQPVAAFDVLREVRVATEARADFRAGIGGSDGNGDGLGDCVTATPTSPVCAIAILPNGARSSVLLSLGPCDPASLGSVLLPAYAQCEDSLGSVVQLLADLVLSPDPLSPVPVATLLVKCDKTLCGTGAIQRIPVHYTLSGASALGDTTPACPAKNSLGTGPDACVDYVQSQRDGSGDTWFYVLFRKDARVSVR